MKKFLTTGCLALIIVISSYGQWYERKYKVDNINLLTKDQLDESLKEAKTGALLFGLTGLLGGTLYLAGRNGWSSEPEDPTFFEQMVDMILGQEGKNEVNKAAGLGILIGGSIGTIAYLGRMGRIRSVMNRNFPSGQSLNISPAGTYCMANKSYCPGVRITYTF